MRSPENIVEELNYLNNKFGSKSFYFYDDLFTFDKKRVEKICELVEKWNVPIKWKCISRVDLVDVVLLKKIGTLLIELIGMVVQQDYFGAHLGFNLLERLVETLRSIFLPSRTTFHDYQLVNHTYLAKNVTRPNESPLDEATKSVTEFVGVSDRIFSAFSVEVRHPFLDPELGSFMILLPPNQKIRRGVMKHILRTAMKGLIPESIRKSKRKFPTSIPLVEWLIDLHPEINEMLSSKAFKERRMFNQDRILEVFNSLCEGKLDPTEARRFASILWRIINLELWLEIYIDPVHVY